MSVDRMKALRVMGLMSGTSLDGLDLCYAIFDFKENKWKAHDLITDEVNYTSVWRKNLTDAFEMDQPQLKALDVDYGKFLGESVNQFIEKFDLKGKVDLIASHGHTIFHEPAKGVTLQIGNGQEIASLTGILVINDFRSLDVSLGGQGAPLVPVGDEFLFAEYDACLNLGGFSNISYSENNVRKAFDIGPCNLPLNKIMRDAFNCEYDENGEVASNGVLITDLLEQLNGIAYYKQQHPKSLGVEWLQKEFYPIVDAHQKQGWKNVLHTLVEHETDQLSHVINRLDLGNVLVTGGGVFNQFLMERLKYKCTAEIVVPDKAIVKFKEALIFAFLGVLKFHGKINTFMSVTGARIDSSGGVLFDP